MDEPTRLHVPSFLREAMEAAGVSLDEVVEKAKDPDVIPSDEVAIVKDKEDRRTGIRCAECEQPANPNDVGVLIEVTGWHRPREQGGQNHVIRRVPTGRMMCPSCSVRFQAGLDAGQRSLL